MLLWESCHAYWAGWKNATATGHMASLALISGHTQNERHMWQQDNKQLVLPAALIWNLHLKLWKQLTVDKQQKAHTLIPWYFQTVLKWAWTSSFVEDKITTIHENYSCASTSQSSDTHWPGWPTRLQCLKCGVSRILPKHKIYTNTEVMLLNHHVWASVYVWCWRHAALGLHFHVLVSLEHFWVGRGCVSPPSITACRWGWEHRRAQWLDTVQTGDSYKCWCSVRKRKYSDSKRIKLVPEWEWVSVQFLALERWRRGWEERCRVGLLCVRQVGAKNRWLAW